MSGVRFGIRPAEIVDEGTPIDPWMYFDDGSQRRVSQVSRLEWFLIGWKIKQQENHYDISAAPTRRTR